MNIISMNITSAQYTRDAEDTKNVCVLANIDGINMHVPLDPDNTHYAEIMRQVEAGDLTIEDAD